jgi:NitT/TauT family transport system ATP-binding protein
MDEPFGSVDEQTRRVLQADLIRVWEKQRQTVVFVTHSMDEAVYLADRVILMSPRPGRVREILDVDLSRPRLDEVRGSARFAEMTAHVWNQLKEFGEDHIAGRLG